MNAGPQTTAWYYVKQGAPPGQQAGPVSWERLYGLARNGTLSPSDLVWNPGLPAWVPAADITGLFPAAPAPMPGPYPGPHPGPAYAQSAPTQWPSVPQPRRRSWLAWVLALAVAAAAALGLGLGLGLRGGDDGGDAASADDGRTTTTKDVRPTSTSQLGPPAWTELSTDGPVPTARMAHAMVYDSDRDQVILFSGWPVTADGNLTDTWAFDLDTDTWRDLSPAGPGPPGRSGHSMVYDPTTERVILFGGWDGWADLDDTWAYDPEANEWSELEPDGPVPPARSQYAMVYDPETERVIMFGGVQNPDETVTDTYFRDTWAYDPATGGWIELHPNGALPPGRSDHALAYDPSTQTVVLFGGLCRDEDGNAVYLADTWAYDPGANTWRQLEARRAVPPARMGHSLACDAETEEIVLFGGGGGDVVLTDTWAYDMGAHSWTELRPEGEGPSATLGSEMVYDPAGERLIVFGGWNNVTMLDETWSLGR